MTHPTPYDLSSDIAQLARHLGLSIGELMKLLDMEADPSRHF